MVTVVVCKLRFQRQHANGQASFKVLLSEIDFSTNLWLVDIYNVIIQLNKL